MMHPGRSPLSLLPLLGPLVLGAGLPAQEQPPDPRSELRALRRELNDALRQWREQQPAPGGDPAATQPATQPPTGPFVARAMAAAARHRGADAAIGFLAFVIGYASTEREAMRQAVAELTSSHAGSDRIGAALTLLAAGGERVELAGRQQVLALYDAVIDRNEAAELRAAALIARGALRLRAAATDAERTAGRGDLERVAAVTDDEDLVAEAERVLFELTRLQVGCTAPDIAGRDTDGVPFRLSDYRGKVVLLEFWGFW